ncbi:cytochrome-c peroxidase [Benzoatithermus flavus]|uniref:Cytochrome c peroxidase n=1 Tax=Benzoatithermus flavus TaxID=3108223 RepID=A0ABU8XRL0_9PROT
MAIVLPFLGLTTVQAAEPPPSVAPLDVAAMPPPGPSPQDYQRYVKNRDWLVVLGKALFWDSAVGSDGQACASCHFHAGADPRTVNQLNPGIAGGDDRFGGIEPASAVGRTAGGRTAGPNLALQPDDFPFHRLRDSRNRNSEILYDTNDVVSSQGVFDGLFMGIRQTVRLRGRKRDFCRAADDTIFTINVLGQQRKVRKVEPRNTPTTINAAYFFRNFWDGRANNVFNGVNPFGRRAFVDPAAGIVTAPSAGSMAIERVQLENASLASQAVGPPNSSFEMACANRTFADIGRKLLGRIPLADQKIAATDSVFGNGSRLGNLVRRTGAGLRLTYLELVKNAFQQRLWGEAGTWAVAPDGAVSASTTGHSQAELNFSLFFGLAIDAYERTLISDQSRFDSGNLSGQEQHGLALFTGRAKCVNCHNGPLFSSAAVPPRQPLELIENMVMGVGGNALYDGGFYNIGVRPVLEDLGVGGKDPWGNPLSFTRQYVDRPADPTGRPDFFQIDFAQPGSPDGIRVAVDGAFKTPSLRNVALTAPYFHNGGERSLTDVVRFYNRGGNRRDLATGDTTGTGPLGQGTTSGSSVVGSNLDPDIQPLGLEEGDIEDLVAFLKALTDDRVACHQAPFDHPELIVSNGSLSLPASGGRARDARLRLLAVGREGYPRAWCDPGTGDLFDRNLIGGMLQRAP